MKNRSPARPRTPQTKFRQLDPDAPLPETFEEMPLSAQVKMALTRMGFERPTPIQQIAIGPMAAGQDFIAMAETGSGKTVAFGAPLVQKVDPNRVAVQALVLCPTRELAQQVALEFERLSACSPLRIQLLIGGEMVGTQMLDMKRNASQVIVGTPGRVLDLARRRFISIEWVEMVVLDEGDEMLDMGFIDDVKSILERTPDTRQTVFFSATFPEQLKGLATRFMRDPLEISTIDAGRTVDTVSQYSEQVHDDDIPDRLAHILRQDPAHTYLVFCERKRDVDRLQSQLLRRRIPAAALHGDYKQEQRFQVMDQFKTGAVRALVATDIASRGLDISHVTHVINIGVPLEPDRYIHRIGRTGRAGRKGVAITLVLPKDRGRWRNVLSHTGDRVRPLEELFGAEEKEREGTGAGTPESRGGSAEGKSEPRADRGPERRSRKSEASRGEPREGQRTERKPEERRERRPDRSTPESSGRPRQERAAKRPAERAAKRPAERAAKRPAERAERRPAERAEKRPAERAEKRPAERAEKRPAERAEERSGGGRQSRGEKRPDRRTDEDREKRTEKSAEKQPASRPASRRRSSASSPPSREGKAASGPVSLESILRVTKRDSGRTDKAARGDRNPPDDAGGDSKQDTEDSRDQGDRGEGGNRGRSSGRRRAGSRSRS